MAYEKELYNTVASMLEQKRNKNQSDLDERRQKIYQKIPEIEQIDKEITGVGLKLMKLAINYSDADLQQKLEQLRNNHNKLFIKRKALLIENGFSPDELSVHYSCSLCKDTGVHNNTYCKCFKRLLVIKSYESSNLSKQLSDQSFKTFDMSLFSDKTDERFGDSPYKRMEYILSTCKEFVKGFDGSGKNLLFWGDPGRGKTFLSTAIAKELIKKGYSVIYETAYKIFSGIEDYKFRRVENLSSLKSQIDRLYECDLLILDDLGSEFITSYTAAALFDIINSRLISGKSTIINTNLSTNELSAKYSDRVYSRIIGSYELLQFIGEDIRLKKGFDNGGKLFENS